MIPWLAGILLVVGCGQDPVPPKTAAVAAKAPERHLLAITHVTLIDPSSGPQPDVTLIIDGDKIREVGPASTTTVPAGAEVHDASGRFALPGLWDAHVHLSQIGLDMMPLYVANGITSVRDMGSALEDVARWKDARSKGEPAPRVFSPGPKIDGTGEAGPDNVVVTTPDAARATVDKLKADGADFIKVHGGLTRPVYEAIVEECRKDGLFFAGHAAGEITPLIAVKAGQRSIEHGRGMFLCSSREREKVRAQPKSPLAQLCAAEGTGERNLSAMARAGVWFTPTLTSWRGLGLTPLEAGRLDGLRYVSPAFQKQRWGDDLAEEPDEIRRSLLTRASALTGRAAREGVHLLAGTDTGDPYVVPAFALHDELELFVHAGVSPLQAIRSATLEPARALGVADTVGTLEAGKAADVLLLTADPLADIRNTRKIAAVVLNGRWLSSEQTTSLIKHLAH